MFRQRESQPNEHLNDELLSAYIDGQVTAAERVRVETHLAGCPSCAGELRVLQATVSLLREMPPAPLPRAFTIPAPADVPALRGRARGASLWDTLTRGWGYRALQGATTLVMALLMTLCAGDLLLQALPGMGPMAAAPAAPSGVPGKEPLAVAFTPTSERLARESIAPTKGMGQALAAPTQAPAPTPPPVPAAATPIPKAAPGTPTSQTAAGAAAETATPLPPPPGPPAATPQPAQSPLPTPTPPGEEGARAAAPSPAATPTAWGLEADAAVTPTSAVSTEVVRYYGLEPSPAVPGEPMPAAALQPDLVRLTVCGIEGALLAVAMGLLIVTGIVWFARHRM